MQATLGQRPKSLSRHEAAIQPPQPDGAAEILRNPSTGGREWFHGTRASSAQLAGGFRTGEGDSDPWFPAHWSTGLGTHFAAHHGSADKFANPSIGVGGKGTAADPEHSHTPSVVHARLHIRNPKVYENEDRMADDVFEHEHGERKNYISRYLYGGDREGDKEVPYAAADYFSYDHHPDEAPARGEYENFDDYEDRAEEFGDEQPEPVYRREQWLNLHPDQAGIARRHRERLQAAGHDGIVYANNSPDERVRSKRPESHQVAIAFHPSQVEITKHHVFGDEHKTAAADDPWRITHDEDDTYHRLAAHDGDEEVGYLTWHKDHPPRYTGEPSTPGLVGEIEVHPDYYHRGIATALWQRAQKYDPAPIHSDHVTGPGSDWIKSLGAARWSPSSGVFGPTTGHDPKLFDGDELRPEVRRDVMERLDRALRVDTGLVGSDWQDWTKVYLAGGSASEWAGERPNDAARDLDILIGVSYHEARRGSGAFQDMDSSQIDTAFNSALRAAFNDPDWHPSFGGTWQLTGYVNPDAYDITKIKPYAAYNVTDMKWAVKPPHLPEHTLDDFDPAILAMARAMATEARAILRMPEPARTHEARALWERLHSDRRRAFSDEGEGWQDPGNLVEKYLAYAPGKLLERIKNLALAIPLTAAKTATLTLYRGEGDHDRPSYYPKTGPDANLTGAWWTSDLEKARGYAKKAGPSGRVYQVEVQPHEAEPHGLPGYYHIPDPKVRERRTLLTAAKTAASPWVFYHGTPDERTWQNSTKGIHVGTEEAARQALNARIGKPHEGEWDGPREYGKTLLSPYQHSGTERDLGEPKYPSGRASYADGTKIPMDARPSIFPVRIVGPMTNHPATPHQDWHANGYMSGQLKRGRAKSGYFYRNEGEDAGSISAVVPSAAHLERIEREPQQRTASVDPYDEETGEPRPWHRKWPGETEEDLTRRRGQYVQQVADAHHVSPAAAHRVIAQVAGDLDSDKAFTDGRKYGFASEPHGHRDVFSEQQIKHLMTPELWHGVPVTQVPTEGIHATQNWLRPRTLAHNLFHPGKKLGQVDDEEGHPDFDPDDLPREEEDYDDIDEGSRPRPDLGEHVRYMRREDGRMQLLDGHHRAAIDIALGKKTTPGTVIDEAKLRAAMRSPVHLHGEEMSAADLHTHLLQHHDRTRSELPEPRDANHLDLVDEHDHSHEFEAPGHEHQVLESAHQRGRIPAATIERYAAADTIYIPPPLPPEALEEAKRSPHKVASSYAQMAMWRDHPRVRMQFPQSHEGGDELVGHMLRHTGYEGDTEGAFVARHPDPSRGRSNAAYLNGKPGVALHPDRWDYGTVAHETAHHTVMYRHAIGPNEPQTDEQVHGPEWSAAYARGLNVISPGAGDAFLHHKQHYLEEIGARGKTAAAERRYMYHSTSPRHRDSIGQGGLRTEFSEDPGDWKSVYMSERPGDDPGQDVWRVDVTGYHPEVDGDSGEDRGVVGESYFLDHDVPPER
ncbi:MAG: GNAT family N-acetyltransferase, partial [Oryzihumus sp.]